MSVQTKLKYKKSTKAHPKRFTCQEVQGMFEMGEIDEEMFYYMLDCIDTLVPFMIEEFSGPDINDVPVESVSDIVEESGCGCDIGESSSDYGSGDSYDSGCDSGGCDCSCD